MGVKNFAARVDVKFKEALKRERASIMVGMSFRVDGSQAAFTVGILLCVVI